MSYLLAIESSTKSLSVALFKDEELLEEIVGESNSKTHSENLLPIIDQLFKKNQIELSDINAIAVAAGPGSFTSLRVGAATVIGLAEGARCPVQPVSSLKALALGVPGDSILIAPVFKSGRGKVYAALFERKGEELKETIKEAVYQPGDFLEQLKSFQGKINFVGPGFELLGLSSSNPINFIYHDACLPRSSLVGLLSFKEGTKPIQVEEFRLRYLQEPDLGGK